MTSTGRSIVVEHAVWVREAGVRFSPPRLIKLMGILLLLFLSGCVTTLGLPKKIHTTTFNDVAQIGSGINFYLSERLEENKRKILISSAIRQLNKFEEDWGKRSRPVDIYPLDTKLIPCGSLKGRFIGCHYGTDGPIHIAYDEYLTATSLYHELVHHNIASNDHDHKDPRWKIWGATQRRLRREIKQININKMR